MWHDFCPLSEIRSQFESVKGVTEGLEPFLRSCGLNCNTYSGSILAGYYWGSKSEFA